jgi:signal transduction histidine kinase
MSYEEVRGEEVGVEWIGRLLATPNAIGAIASGVVLYLIYVLVAELSYYLVIPPSPSAVFWLPSGISFFLFVRARWQPKIWPFWLSALFLGEFLTVRHHGIPPVTAFAWASANAILPFTIALLSRRLVLSPFDFRRLRDVLAFMAMTALAVIPGAVAAAAGTGLGRNSASLISFAVSWAASDAMGIILVAPVILSWATRGPRPAGRYAEALLLLFAMTASSIAIFVYTKRAALNPALLSLDRSLISFPFFFVAWAAIRFGPRGTSMALLIIDFIEVWATRLGFGPFASPELTTSETLLNLQILTANLGLLMLLLAAAIEEQRMARITAETALRTRDDFLSVASHELKTPLTSLAMQIQMINRSVDQGKLSGPSVGKLRHLGSISERALFRFSALINDLLDVSRISAGRMVLDLEEVDLQQAVQDVVSRLHIELENNRCSIKLNGDSRVIGQWDRLRLEQVVANLVSNALKYGAGHPIEIAMRQERDVAILTVRDHGIGISDADQIRIFERFERAVSIKRFGGLGLGLFIARQIVEAHGGSIRVESEVGRGSSFSVILPLKPAMARVA